MSKPQPETYLYFNLGGKRIYAPSSAYKDYFCDDKDGFTRLCIPQPGDYKPARQTRQRTAVVEVMLYCEHLLILFESKATRLPSKIIATYKPGFPLQPAFEIRLGQALLAISRRQFQFKTRD